MTKHVIDAFMFEGAPIVSISFEKGLTVDAIFAGAKAAISELCGPTDRADACAAGHPGLRFQNGATACMNFEKMSDTSLLLRLTFHAAPPADCPLMLLLKTNPDKKRMN